MRRLAMDIRELENLEMNARLAAASVMVTNNEKTRTSLDAAVDAVIAYRQQHKMPFLGFIGRADDGIS